MNVVDPIVQSNSPDEEPSQSDRPRLRSSNSITNRNTRVLAVQCIYILDFNNSNAVDITSHDAMQNLDLFLHSGKQNKINARYFVTLVNQAYAKKEDMYTEIGKHLETGRSLGRMSYLVRAILHVGAYEVMYNEAISKKVLINEYVELSKLFNHAGEAKFVNFVLDKILKAHAVKTE